MTDFEKKSENKFWNALNINTLSSDNYWSEMAKKWLLLKDIPETHPEIFNYRFENDGKHTLDNARERGELLNSNHYNEMPDPKSIKSYKEFCHQKHDKWTPQKSLVEEITQNNIISEIKDVQKWFIAMIKWFLDRNM